MKPIVLFFVFQIVFLNSSVVYGQSDCKFSINELNIIDPKRPERNEFVELKSTCDAEIHLRGYKLIGFNCKGKSGSIDLIVTLWNSRTDKNGFFTIGGNGVSTAQLKVSDVMVKYRSGFNPKQSSIMSNFLDNRDIRAIGLIYDMNNPFTEFALTKKQSFIKITEPIIEKLKKYLIDLVIYAPKKECDKCELFEIIHEEFASQDYTLREFVMNKDKSDISLNRCAVESAGFLPNKFKLGNPTPGKENDCSGPRFVLEEHITDIVATVNQNTSYADDFDDLEGASCSSQCTSSIESSDRSQIDKERMQTAISAANDTSRRDICTNVMLDPNGGNTAVIVEHETQRKRRMSTDHDHSEELEWKTSSHFQSQWLQKIKTYQSNLIPLDDFEHNKVWIEYLFNSKEPEKSTYRCRLCYKYFDEIKIRSQYKSGFAEKEGTLKSDKSRNKFAITSHESSPSHKTIVDILQTRKAKRLFFCNDQFFQGIWHT